MESNNQPAPEPRRVAVMGSTGSIGTQTLDVMRRYPERFEAVALTAGRNWQLLASQALEMRPKLVVIADTRFYQPLVEALAGSGIRVLAGAEALCEASTLPEVDVVVGALVGYSGLRSTIAALEDGKQMALANKETLVVAGSLIEGILRRTGRRILPVDSEHSAIFQCLYGEDPASVARIILTASGGPFRKYAKSDLCKVSVAQALAHPNWDMGAKVTIDSATMMNKGFEMIEARWLFNMAPRDIEVVVHPESIVHSMVEFADGSVKAQLGLPDMRLPIEVALSYPERLNLRERLSAPRLDLTKTGALTFEAPDADKFPLLDLAYRAAEEGGLVPAVMNAANEVAVRSFLEEKIGFCAISDIVTRTVDRLSDACRDAVVTPDSIAEAHREGTKIALSLTKLCNTKS